MFTKKKKMIKNVSKSHFWIVTSNNKQCYWNSLVTMALSNNSSNVTVYNINM